MADATDAEIRGLGWIALAEAEQEPVDVSIGQKSKSLRKFGKSDVIDNTGYKTLWDHASDQEHEVLQTSNSIDAVSSSSESDTMDLRIEGHTISGTDLTFVVQTVTMTGQTAAALGTPLARVTRVQVQGSTANVGDIYVHQGGAQTSGVPNDAASVHSKIPVGQNQTRKAATAISKDDYYFVTRFFASVNRQNSTAVDVVLEVKSTSGVWFPTFAEIGLHTQGATSYQLSFDPPMVIAPNSDLRVVAQGSASADTAVSASVAGYLGSVQS